LRVEAGEGGDEVVVYDVRLKKRSTPEDLMTAVEQAGQTPTGGVEFEPAG
jgi:hypothetical protein